MWLSLRAAPKRDNHFRSPGPIPKPLRLGPLYRDYGCNYVPFLRLSFADMPLVRAEDCRLRRRSRLRFVRCLFGARIVG